MDFVAVMLLLRQVFHIDFFKSQPGVAYESVVSKKKYLTLLFSLLKMNLLLYLSGILSVIYCQKIMAKSRVRGDGHTWQGLKPSTHYLHTLYEKHLLGVSHNGFYK